MQTEAPDAATSASQPTKPPRWYCTRRAKIAWVVLTIIGLAVVAVGLYFLLRPKGNDVKLSVTALSSALNTRIGARAPALQSASGLAPSSAVPSLTESAYAQVDALTLNVAYVRTASVAGSGHDLASTDWGASRTLTLLPGVNTVPLTDTIKSMSTGPYFAADFVFWNRWSIQAFCRTANAFLYTTATGVKSLGSTPSSMPSDYGALLLDHMNGEAFFVGEGATATAAQARMTFINSQYYYNVDSSTTVALLVDTNYVVACYDGSFASRNAFQLARGNAQMISPLGYDMSYGGGDNYSAAVHEVFNWTAPQFNFGTWSLPVFVQVSSGDTVAAVGETYAFANNASLLPTAIGTTPIDWGLVTVVTVTWSGNSSSDTLLDVRMRGRFGGGNDPSYFGLWGGCFNFTNATSGWQFYNGQQKYFDYRMLAERLMIGFNRAGAGDYTTVGSVNVTDGPECGVAPGGNGQANPCLNTSRLFYYVQLPRN